MEPELIKDDVYTFIENTLVGSFMKIARVNVLTGEYEFLKIDSALHDVAYDNIPDIFSYIKKQVESKIILSRYAVDYLKFSDPEYVRRRVFSGERRITQSYKRISGIGDIWLTFAIIVPSFFDEKHPWVLFTWREADQDTTTMVDAVATLSVMYCKILKINLTTGAFTVVKLDEHDERPSDFENISHWWRSFGESGNVFKYDLDIYYQFTELEHLRSYFKKSKSKISCRYRRKIDGTFRWVQMDLVPSIEYSDDNQILILYVKDINEEYLREMSNLQELENNYSRDALTLLYNRHKYSEDLENLSKETCSRLTCLYADVNGLHEVNNLLGHKKGDDMLCCVADALRKYYPDDRIYRIGGDEFVMLSKRSDKETVEGLARQLKKYLDDNHYAISIGIESGENVTQAHDVISAAELAMRKDKELYYESNTNIRKRRTMNEELEKMLLEKRDSEQFLKVISKRYAGVYFVNLKSDLMRYIFIPEHFSEQLESSEKVYSAALKSYAEKYVAKEYFDDFCKFLDYSYIERELAAHGSIQYTYEKYDGTFMDLRIQLLDNDKENSDETLWIFSYSQNNR